MASRLDVVANADPPRFTVTDLGPYEATFISNDGQILGNDYSGPWLWRNGARVMLNGDGLKKISSVSAVNRSGHVAGALLAGDYRIPFFGDVIPGYHACLWRNGEITDLGTLGGPRSAVLSLNNSNIVVGLADDSSNQQHPFIWRDGTMSRLQIRFPTNGVWRFEAPLRVTDDGRILGVGTVQDTLHAIQLTPLPDSSFDFVDIGALKGSHPSVYSFNDFGWASGFARYEEPTRVEAFLFKAAAGTLLGNLGSSGSYGRNLNNLGDVVGFSNSESYRAFLWREGTIYDLNACIPPDSGWLLADANAINDAGQIVGHGILNGTGEINGGGIVNGGHRAFMLNPMLGSAQALQLTLERTPQLNQWRLRLARQPTTNLYFEVSSDLVKWSPVNHSGAGGSFLIQDDTPAYHFFRAAFKP